MNHVKNYFMYSPMADNEQGNTGASGDRNTASQHNSAAGKEEKKDNRSWFRKLRDALQDWSNGDQRQQEFDDTRV